MPSPGTATSAAPGEAAPAGEAHRKRRLHASAYWAVTTGLDLPSATDTRFSGDGQTTEARPLL